MNHHRPGNHLTSRNHHRPPEELPEELEKYDARRGEPACGVVYLITRRLFVHTPYTIYTFFQL